MMNFSKDKQNFEIKTMITVPKVFHTFNQEELRKIFCVESLLLKLDREHLTVSVVVPKGQH